MRITGTLHTIGGITTCDHNTDPDGPEYIFENLQGVIITTDDDDALRAASNLLCATVDIYPHPVDGLQPGVCTPERYAHALARLAHTEDHLAREVRSSQAAMAALETMRSDFRACVDTRDEFAAKCDEFAAVANKRNDYIDELLRRLESIGERAATLETAAKERAASDAEEARRRELDADAKSAAWTKYLDLRKQIRRAAEDKRPDAEVHALMNEALTISREHDLDPTTLELEEARRTIDALHAQIALTPKDIADAQRIINIVSLDNERVTKENLELRVENGALRIAKAALAGKQAEQERLMTAYRVQYHEADRALRKAQADLDALNTAKVDEADDFEGDDDANEVMDKV